MPDTSIPSLLTRAERLRAAGRKLAEEAGEVQNRERFVRAVSDLQSEVDEVRRTLQAMTAGMDKGFAGPVDRTKITQGARNLQAVVDGAGRPTPEKVRGSLKALKSERERLDAMLLAQWRKWARVALEGIPTERFALLSEPNRRSVQEAFARLQKDAERPPTPAIMRMFELSLGNMTAQLDEIRIDGALESALKRLGTLPSPSLADYSDEEIAALRADGTVAAQVVLRRR